MGLIIDGVRWILWLICKGCFFVVDSIYNIIMPIISFDISTNSTMWSWWYILCTFLFFFTLIRLFSMFLKAGIDEDYRLKLEPMGIIVRIVAIAIIIAAMPLTIKYFTSLSSVFIKNASNMFVVENNIVEQKPTINDAELNQQIEKVYEEYKGMPSMLFISSSSNGEYPPYMLISINEKKGGLSGLVDITGGIPIIGGLVNISTALLGLDGDYIYYPDTTMLIFLIIEAICTCYMFFLMAIQISQRIYSIGVKILISPLPISSLVKQDDHTFGLWVKLLAADLISNALQYFILLFVMMISSSQEVQQFGIVGQGIFFIGGLLCVLIGPGQIAQLIGGDGMGLFQTMQGFQTMSALKGMTQAAGRTIAGAAGLGASLGIYGAGRALGMNSLGNFPSGGDSGGGANPSASQGPGGGGANPFASKGRNPLNGNTGKGPSIPPRAFSEPSTEAQRAAAKSFGFNAEHMSKGQASLELEKRGMDRSYWSNHKGQTGTGRSSGQQPDTAGFDGFTGGTATGTIDKSNGTYGFGNAGAYTSTSSANAGIDDLGTYDDGNDYLGVNGGYDDGSFGADAGNDYDGAGYYNSAGGYYNDSTGYSDAAQMETYGADIPSSVDPNNVGSFYDDSTGYNDAAQMESYGTDTSSSIDPINSAASFPNYQTESYDGAVDPSSGTYGGAYDPSYTTPSGVDASGTFPGGEASYYGTDNSGSALHSSNNSDIIQTAGEGNVIKQANDGVNASRSQTMIDQASGGSIIKANGHVVKDKNAIGSKAVDIPTNRMEAHKPRATESNMRSGEERMKANTAGGTKPIETPINRNGPGNHTAAGEGNKNRTSANQSTRVQPNIQQEQQKVEPRLSREGTIARRVGNAPGRKAKVAYMVGRLAYAAAGNRLMGQRSVYRGGRYITKNTRAQMFSNLHANVNEIIKPAHTQTKRDKEDLSELAKFNKKEENK